MSADSHSSGRNHWTNQSTWPSHDECSDAWIVPQEHSRRRTRFGGEGCFAEWRLGAMSVRTVQRGELATLVDFNAKLEQKYQQLIDAESPAIVRELQAEIDDLEEKAAELISLRAGRRINQINRQYETALELAKQLLRDEDSSEDHPSS